QGRITVTPQEMQDTLYQTVVGLERTANGPDEEAARQAVSDAVNLIPLFGRGKEFSAIVSQSYFNPVQVDSARAMLEAG
ncbi:MAG: hypothetical protein ABSH12_03390, partial [Endomicrobiales bacterium]